MIVGAARAWVVLYSTVGAQVAIFDDWISLEVKKKIGDVYTLTFEIDGNDSRTALFTLDSIIEVWRIPDNNPKHAYIEYTGMHRITERQLTTDQKVLFISGSVGLLHLLKRRVIAYPTVTPFTLKQAPAETVMKQIVNENAGPGASIAVRYGNGVTPGLSIQTDTASGPIYTAQLTNESVLTALQAINTAVFISNTHKTVDYDIVRIGPVKFEFRTYYPQLGVDRTAYLAFAPELGNMANVVYRYDASNAINTVFVLGPGQDSARWILPVLGASIGVASPWDILEGTVGASSNESTLGASYESMTIDGNKALNNGIPQEPFTFDVVQENIALYGRDYFLGDLLTARIQSVSRTVKFVGVTLTIKDGVETIRPEFSDLP